MKLFIGSEVYLIITKANLKLITKKYKTTLDSNK